MVYIDNVFIGRKLLSTPPGIDSTMQFITPWLPAGPHAVQINWENVHSLVGLKIESVTLQQFTGTNAAQAVASLVAGQTFLDNVPVQSVVSPVCVEGSNQFANTTAVTVNGVANPVKPALLGNWYSDVPLAGSGSTAVSVAFESGAQTLSNTITWVPLNLACANNMTIRANDSLMLTAYPTNQGSGTVAIQVAGLTNYTTTVASPVICQFPTGGVYTVSGTWQGNAAGAITVTVMQASFPATNPACMLGYLRNWNCPNVPASAWLESDASVTLGWTNQVASINMSEIYSDHYMVARLYPGGPILGSQHLDGFWVQAAVDSYFWVLQTYPDGSQLWQDEIFTKNVPASVSIQIHIFIGGVTFDDGTTTRWITSTNLDALGTYTFDMIRPASVTHSTCHTIYMYQGSTYLGEAYEGGYLLPEE